MAVEYCSVMSLRFFQIDKHGVPLHSRSWSCSRKSQIEAPLFFLPGRVVEDKERLRFASPGAIGRSTAMLYHNATSRVSIKISEKSYQEWHSRLDTMTWWLSCLLQSQCQCAPENRIMPLPTGCLFHNQSFDHFGHRVCCFCNWTVHCCIDVGGGRWPHKTL